MTLSYGVTDQGFVLPSQQQLLAAMVSDQQATISQSIDTSSDSVIGQLNGVFTRQLMLGYEALQVAYESNDPDVVEGFLQTQLAKLTGTQRLAATASTVILSCTLNAGTTLTAATTLVSIQGNPASQWTPKATFTAPTTGVYALTFVSTTTGPNTAPAGSSWVITTPVTGWPTAPTNSVDATLGTNVETDADLRIRRELELQGGGSGNADAIRSALLKVAGVQSATVVNNISDVTDANGIPPHSIEAIIYDGVTPVASNNAVAQVLWNDGAAGIRCYGTSTGTALDVLGTAHTLAFSRVISVPVFIAFTLTPRQGYPGDASFKSQMATLLAAQFGTGVYVDAYDIILNTTSLGALVTGLSFGLTTPSPTVPGSITTSVLGFTPVQIAYFSPANFLVNGA